MSAKEPAKIGCCVKTSEDGMSAQYCCCMVPVKWLQISAGVNVLIAWIFAVSAAGVCDFMARVPKEDYDYNDPFMVGLFGAKGTGDDCESFDDLNVDLDSAIEAGQAFAVMTSLFGGFILIGMIVSIFVRFPPILWRIMMIALFVLAPFQLFTLSALGAEICTTDWYIYEDGCLPAAGGSLSIIAFWCWLMAGILLCRMPAPEKPLVDCCNNGAQCCGGQPGQQQNPSSVVTTANPATAATTAMVPVAPPIQKRTKTITEEKINPDGSRTITTTVVEVND